MRPPRAFRGGGETIWHPPSGTMARQPLAYRHSPPRMRRGGEGGAGEFRWKSGAGGADGGRHDIKSAKVHGIIEADVEDVLSFSIP